jgi:hypothetical protein
MKKEVFSTMAVLSFILGGAGLGGAYYPASLWILRILIPASAIVLGILGLREVYKNKRLKLRGRRTSMAGIILGILGLVITIIGGIR